MNSSTNITPSREWISLKDSQPYAHLVEKILLEWIRRPAEPMPVTRVRKRTLISQRTFDRWLATRSSSWCCRDLGEAMPWLSSNNFASLADAWDSCERGGWMLWLLERADPLTEKQWAELDRALKPFWVKRFKAQSPAETEQAIAEFERGQADALRQIVGNPWRSHK